MGQGVGIRTATGISLKVLLCDHLGVDPNYLEDRIQTILVNGRAVDHVDQVNISDGDVIALSAAMPGLVGTTLRKGGHLAPMRTEISQQRVTSDTIHGPGEGIITLKLFNMVAKEIGTKVLSRGIWLKGKVLAAVWPQISGNQPQPIHAEPDEWAQLQISSEP